MQWITVVDRTLSKVRSAISHPELIAPYLKRSALLAYALASHGRYTPALLSLIDLIDDGDRYRTYLESNDQARYLACDVLDFRMLIDLLDEGISRDLLIDGVREPLATAAYQTELDRLEAERGGLTVIDVGANIGYFALAYLSRSRIDGNLLAIEPLPDNFSLLEANIRRNGFEDVADCYQFAVGAESKSTTMQVSTHSNLATVVENQNRSHLVDETDVTMRSLDGFLSERDIPFDAVDVLRMDVQGYEYEIFRGMSELLRRGDIGLAFLEIHPEYLRAEGRYDRFITILQTAGFDLVFAADGRTSHVRPDKPSCSERVLQIDSLEELRDVEFTVEVILRRE